MEDAGTDTQAEKKGGRGWVLATPRGVRKDTQTRFEKRTEKLGVANETQKNKAVPARLKGVRENSRPFERARQEKKEENPERARYVRILQTVRATAKGKERINWLHYQVVLKLKKAANEGSSPPPNSIMRLTRWGKHGRSGCVRRGKWGKKKSTPTGDLIDHGPI